MDSKNNEDRRLLPRWRSLSRTPSIELASASHHEEDKLKDIIQSSYELAQDAWLSERSVSNAHDLLAAELASGMDFNPEAIAAIKPTSYVVKALENVRALRQERVERGSYGAKDQEERGRVRYLKKHLREFERDAISWCELALAYTRLGEIEAARRSIHIARALAPLNRYVARSHIRFAAHIGDDEERVFSVKNLQISDPWIASAAFAVRETKGIYLPKRKSLDGLVRSTDLHSGSELAAGLATDDILSGARSRGKKLANLSLRCPTDNTMAQMRWLEGKSKIQFKVDVVPTLSFEAKFSEFSLRGEWARAEEEGLQWIADEPFSFRAMTSVIFNCLEFTRNYSLAVMLYDRLERLGIKDEVLFVGKGPALAYLGRHEEAKSIADLVASKISDRENPIVKFNKIMINQMSEPNIYNSLEVLDLVKRYGGEKNRKFRARAMLHWIRILRFSNYKMPENFEAEILSKCQDEKQPLSIRLLSKKIAEERDQLRGKLNTYNLEQVSGDNILAPNSE